MRRCVFARIPFGTRGRFVAQRSRSRDAIIIGMHYTRAMHCIQMVRTRAQVRATRRYLDTALGANQRRVPSFAIHRSAGM